MSFADYSQRAEDHQTLLVLVQSIGSQVKSKTYQKLFDRISRLQSVAVPGQQRNIKLRYKKLYPAENNEWGDFQAHRKVLGLITLAKCQNENDLTELYQQFDEQRQQYCSTLYDSRLIVLGLSKEGSTLESVLTSNKDTDDEAHKRLLDHQDIVNSNVPESSQDTNVTIEKTQTFIDPLNANALNGQHVTDETGDSLNNGEERTNSITECLPKNATSSQIIFYQNGEDCPDLESKIQEFVASLYWVLESKRLDRSQERSEKLTLLTAPFERKDYVGVDTDGRVFKKRCAGRLKKQLGDLCLQAGLPGEAMLHYHTCLDTLRSANDWLWLGGAFEGLCSASVIVVYPHAKELSMQRNASFSVKRGSSAMQLSKVGESFTKIQSNSLPNGTDMDQRPRHCLQASDIIDKYKEAVMHYSKYKSMGIIELEASIKACRILITQQKFLLASEFLQNVVYISLELSEEEKIQRYSTLSQLYSEVGMLRKAAFFRRIAAMQCVAPVNPRPAWQHCYNLLILSLDGYKLSMDPKDEIFSDAIDGWPVLQLRVLHELIYSARRMGNPAIAVRHLMFVLHTMFDELSIQERKEIADVLQSYTNRIEASPQSLALENGVILPPVPLLKFPTIKCFRLQCLTPHLRPRKVQPTSVINQASVLSSPFIYSPLQMLKDPPTEPQTECELVAGEVCEVLVQMHNPLPFELNLVNMGLMADGCEFEVFPAGLVMQPESSAYQLKLMGVPQQPGCLTIHGYTTVVLGCRSNCRLRDVPQLDQDSQKIQVVPQLPQLQVTTSLPKAASFSSLADSATVVTSAVATLYAGQSEECQIELVNTGKHPVESIVVSLDSRLDKDVLESVFTWNENNLKSQLPLAPGGHAFLTLYMTGASTFVACEKLTPENSMSSSLSRSGQSMVQSLDPSETLNVEALLKLQYCGGPGGAAGYYRESAVALTVEVLPSLLIDTWDVLPSQIFEHCHLVLDVRNVSSKEVCLYYGSGEDIIIPSQQCRRISMEISRCNKINEIIGHTGSSISSTSLEKDLSRHRPLSRQVSCMVDIRWKMASASTEGHLRLERLTWTSRQTQLLVTAPVKWKLRLGGETWKADKIKTFTTCEVIPLRCSVYNLTGDLLDDVEVILTCYREQADGCRPVCEDIDVTWMGSHKAVQSQFAAGGKLRHSAELMFLHPGNYSLELQCCATILPPTEHSSAHDVRSVGHNPTSSENTRQSMSNTNSGAETTGISTAEGEAGSTSSRKEGHASDNSTVASSSSPDRHVNAARRHQWIHIPTVAISITDSHIDTSDQE